MYLIVANSGDETAIWLRDALQARGRTPLVWLPADLLARARRWEHRVGADPPSVKVDLPDGTRLDSAEVRGVVNRLTHAPDSRLMLARPAEREYAQQEWSAFFLSWLYALPGPVLNRPTPQGLCGEWRHRSQWMWLAARAGLSTPVYRQNGVMHDDGYTTDRALVARPGWTPHTVLVVAGRVAGPPCPEPVARGALRLSALATTPVLGVDFAVGPDGTWLFAGASPMPDLRAGGDAVIDAIDAHWRGEAAAS